MPQMKTIQFPGSDDVYEVVDEQARESIKAQQETLNGKLDANKLPDAVDDALAKAKASGEFKGEPGDPGQPGADGISPTVNVSKSGKVTTIAITDKNGTKTATVNDGADGSPGESGRDGEAGFSPEVSVATITGGHRVTITDASGEKSFDVMDGKDGVGGEDGATFYPNVSADGTLSWTNDKGLSNPSPVNIKGATGADGSRGMGILKVTSSLTSYTTPTGGQTPTKRMSLATIKKEASVSEVLVGDVISHSYYLYPIYYIDSTYAYTESGTSIRGAAGSAGAAGKDGKDGYTPVKGVDYWTESDQESIVHDVIEAINAPDYVVTEAERVAAAVQSVRTAHSLVLLCASDIHTLMTNAQSVETTLHLAQGMSEICKRVAVDGIAILGDSAFGSSTSTAEETKFAFAYLRKNLAKGEAEIWIPGNHDHFGKSADGNYLTADELYSYIGANTTDKAATDYDNLHRMYGYVDCSKQRIRVIYLNTSDITDSYAYDYGMSTVQAQWFADTLAAVPSGWGAVVMSHHPLNGYISAYLGTLTILDAYKGKGAGSVTVGGRTVTYDFSDAQGELICHLHGHIHNYQVAKYGANDVLSITIPNGCFDRNNEYGQQGNADWGDEVDGAQRVINKTSGTAEDTAFTAVVIDRASETIHALRYGAGIDRVVSYADIEKPETIAVTWYDGQRFSSSSGAMKSDDGVGQTSAYLSMDDLAVGEGYQITGLVFNGNAYANTYVTAYENDVYTGHYFVTMGMDVTYATHYNCVVAADGSSLTIYKNSAPTSGASCKVGVTGAGVGANAVVVKVIK